MFTFQKDYRFTWPVTVFVPTNAGQEEQSFTGHFRLLPKAELEELLAKDPGNDDATVCRAALVGWGDDLVTEEKAQVPFSKDALEQLVMVPFIRVAIARAYWTAANGVLRVKN